MGELIPFAYKLIIIMTCVNITFAPVSAREMVPTRKQRARFYECQRSVSVPVIAAFQWYTFRNRYNNISYERVFEQFSITRGLQAHAQNGEV